MSRKILTAILLLLAAALVADPQTNTFCANNLACTVTGAWNFTGGLQNNGIAVPTLPVNLATQVTGTLPGTNYAQVNLAGSGNGGVGGVLPAANHPATTSNCTGVQFAQGLNAGMTPVCATPPTFVASGASHAVGYVPDPGSSAGTTRFLREDATWIVPTSASPEQTLTWSFNVATGASICATGSATPQCVFYVLANAHTITRVVTNSSAAESGCGTFAQFGIRDMSNSTNLASVTMGSTGVTDSGALSVATTAGHTLAIGQIVGDSGCTTHATVQSLTINYQ